MKIISRVIRIIKRDGLGWSFLRVVALFLRQPLEVQRAKNKVWGALLKKYKYKVAHGPFKGMTLGENVWWSANDRITQTLGIYEKHVLDMLIDFSSKETTKFIDIGAADGYFAVGMAFGDYFRDVHAFEISEEGQKHIKKNALRNKCKDRVTAYGEANLASLKGILNDEERAVVLIDIEGFEYDLLSLEMLSLLKKCFLVCELHPWMVECGNEKQEKLLRDASEYFDLSLIKRETYNPNQFVELDEFTDEERLIAVGEARRKNMNWLVLHPKNL